MSDNWLPIESAPKDGTKVLLFPFHVASWDFGDEAWIYAVTSVDIPDAPPGTFFCSYAQNPTHWMPLPDPPKD